MTLLLIPLLLYLAIAVALFLAQTSLVFPANRVGPAGPLPATVQTLELAVPSGDRLHGVHIPAATATGERLLVLGFAGNATNAAAAAAFLHELYPHADVAAFHYRGYAPSTGIAGAAALRDDALRVHDYLRQRLRPARTVAVGFSVGSGVAAWLAAHRPLDGLLLVTPFDSLAAVAAGHYPWLPVRLLFRHRLEPVTDLAGTRLPVAVIAGGRDSVVPPPRTEALRRAIPNLVYDRTFPDSGHNDIYDHPDFRRAMHEALAVTLAPASPAA